MKSEIQCINNSPADDLSVAISSYLSFCRSKNLADSTINRYYRYRLRAFAEYCAAQGVSPAPRDITASLIREFLIHEGKDKSPGTANHSFTTLRAFFNFLVEDGFLATTPMTGVRRMKVRRKVIQTFSLEQIETMLATCGRDFLGIRDRAIVIMLLDTGLRVAELCGLTLDDISWSEQTVFVLGKGNVERIVPFSSTTRQAITKYLTRRGELECKNLFVTYYGDPMTRHRVYKVIDTMGERAGITGVRCSPHTLRHTSAVHMARAGMDLFSLQKLLGHRDLATTRKYCELSDADVAKQHRLFSPADRLTTKETNGRKRLR